MTEIRRIADYVSAPVPRPVVDWPDPTPLEPPRPPAPAFPLSVFPDWIGEHVLSVADTTQTDPTLGATVALGAVSAALTLQKVTVAVEDGWVDGTNLYLACVLPSGATKSPVYKHLMAPLVEGVVAHHEERQAERRRAESEMRVIEQRIALAEKALVKEPDSPSARGELDSALRAREDYGELPGTGVELHDDITPEEVAHQLKAAGGVMVVCSDEGGFLDGLDRYVDVGKASNLNAVLKAHSGGRITVARRSHDPIVIPSARMAICLTCQPAVVDRLMANPEYAGRGLPARFMLSYPQHRIGTRDFTTGHRIDEVAQHAYEAAFTTMSTGAVGRELAFDEEALAAFRAFRQELEGDQVDEGPLAHMSAQVAKVVTSVARTAAILHLVWGRPGAVSGESVADAILVGRFWIGTLRSIMPEAIPEDEQRDRTAAKRLVRWLQRERPPQVTIRDISRSGVVRASHGARVEQFAPVVQLLINHGWLRPITEDWDNPTPRAESGSLAVNPVTRHPATTSNGEWRSGNGESPPSRQSRVAPKGLLEEKPPLFSDFHRLSSDRRDTRREAPDTDFEAEW